MMAANAVPWLCGLLLPQWLSQEGVHRHSQQRRSQPVLRPPVALPGLACTPPCVLHSFPVTELEDYQLFPTPNKKLSSRCPAFTGPTDA